MELTSDDAAHVAIRLRASVSHLGRQLRAGMPEQALGSAALGVLSQLYRGGALTPTQLARREGVRPQTLTRLLAELEAAGHITRRAHEHDGRQSLLTLAPRGARLLTGEAKRREASLAAVVGECLGPRERAALLKACELIDRVADAMAGDIVDSAPPASTGAPTATR